MVVNGIDSSLCIKAVAEFDRSERDRRMRMRPSESQLQRRAPILASSSP